MRRFTAKLSDLLRLLDFRTRAPRKARRRLQLEALEDRSLLSAAGLSGNVMGTVFVDINNDGVQDNGEVGIPGIVVSLTGTSAIGTAVNSTATTDSNGAYNFTNVAAGSYQLSSSSTDFVGGINIPLTFTGQTVDQDIAYKGLAPGAISLADFLTTSTPATLPIPTAGSGTTSVGTRSNSPPVVSTPIANVSVAENAASTTLDLAGNFSDPDLANSEVEFETNFGPVDVTLYDAEAPQTVANFYDYINSGGYNNDIFHRLTSESKDGLAVLQGGGFNFESNPSQLVPVTAFPAVDNEPDFTNRPNTLGTIAMAKTSDPNSATSQFFFNLADNSQSLDDTSNSGGFTVFGAIANTASQTVVNDMAALTTQDESSASALPSSEQGVFNEIPLQNYSGTSFPTDTTSANYAIITGVKILSRPEYLTYSIVSNSDPSLVTATLGTGDNDRLTLAYASGQTGKASITVEATDTFGATVTDTFTVYVGLALTPSSLPADTINTAYNQTITASGGSGTTTLAVTNIANPIAGLTVPTSGTGSIAITGTPTATGSETFTVTATDSSGATTSTNYTLTVNPALTLTPTTLPAGSAKTAYSQTISTSGGSGTVTLAVTNVTNAIAGLTVPTSGTGTLAISGTPTGSGTETFTVTATDAAGATTSANYSSTVNPTLTPSSLVGDTTNTAYDQTITATGTGPIALAVTNVQNAVAGLTVPTSGTGSLAITGTPTATGTETFTVTATDPSGAKTSTDYSITVNPALTLTPATLPAGTTGTAYSETITAGGGTGTPTLVVSNLTSAIAGLTVPTNGSPTLTITGTPTGSGTETFTVTATDAAGATTSTHYSITIDPELSPSSLPSATINSAYNQTITATGTGPITLAVTAVQNAIAGLNVPTSGTGSLAISGTPTAAGTESFTVTATDPSGATTSTGYSITVTDSPTTAGIANVTASENAADSVVDLAGDFSDPGITNSEVAINTSLGTIDVTLYDSQAPQTVANFYDYINSGAYTNDIFHRLNSVGITNITEATGTTATVNLSSDGLGLEAGQTESVTISGETPSGYNGTFTATVVSPTQFTITTPTNLGNDTAHGAVTNLAILQGGGFTYQSNPSQLVPVTAFPAVANEFDATTRPNVAGTIAMAKTSDPNSATSQFFFNLADNSQSLDNTANSGGFTVFGAIANSASQTVVNELAALMTQDESSASALPASEQGVFNEIPLQNYTGSNFPTDTTSANYALISSVTIVSRPQYLTYAIVSNTNTGLVTATLGTQDNNDLTLAYAAGQTGTATITVKATNVNGLSVTTSFTVTVS